MQGSEQVFRPQTMAERLLTRRVGRPVYAGEVVIAPVDGAMASDTTAPLAIQAFEEMGGVRLWDPERFHLVIDHAAPAPNERIAELHGLMRRFATQQGCHLYEAGEGICHQLMIERRRVAPGELFVGADSHTCTYGAVGAFATGVGSTDLAAVMRTGALWLQVPESIKVTTRGRLPAGVSAKDLTLYLVGRLGISGATYAALELGGEAIEALRLDERMTLANMAVEMGAKAALIHPRGLKWAGGGEYPELEAEPGARYIAELELDVSALNPQVSLPGRPDLVTPLSSLGEIPISYAFIGTCVNGRIEDLRAAAEVLAGQRIPTHVRLLVAPASRDVFLEALQDGTAQTLTLAGATFLPSGCGPCVGTHNGVPSGGEVVISTGNRNFKGRMGNPRADVYLASPVVVAASALAGRIVSQEELNAHWRDTDE